MYDTLGYMPMQEECKEPDWAAQVAREKSDFLKILDFEKHLLEFIETIGHGRRRGDKDLLALLLGTVKIDLMERQKRIITLTKKLESKHI